MWVYASLTANVWRKSIQICDIKAKNNVGETPNNYLPQPPPVYVSIIKKDIKLRVYMCAYVENNEFVAKLVYI